MRLFSEKDLNEQLDGLYLTPKQKDNVRHLIENISDRYSNQIENMKCCGNCDNNAYCDKEHYGNNKGCDKWELAE